MEVAPADWNERPKMTRWQQLGAAWRAQQRVSGLLQQLELSNRTEADDREVALLLAAAQQGALAIASLLRDDHASTLPAIELKLTMALELLGVSEAHPDLAALDGEARIVRELIRSALRGLQDYKKQDDCIDE